MPAAEPIVSGRGLTRTYPPDVVALADVDVAVSAGQMLAITGPSGSGKSTLLSLLGLLDRPSGGHVTLQCRDTGRLDSAAAARLRARHIGLVFQAFHLVAHLSSVENVALGAELAGTPPQAAARAAHAALHDVGLGGRLHAYPGTLSGGEQQRVAIARALVKRPSLLLCDEPTGNLDDAAAGRVLDLLRAARARQQCAVVVVTHDAGVAAAADRTLHLSGGKAVAG